MASEDLAVNGRVTVPGWELVEAFTTSGGPGGQHANKASTRVELRFDVAHSSAFTPAEKRRVTGRLGPALRIVADDERSQVRNRELARQRLAEALRKSLVPPRRRVPTRPTRGSKERRLEGKRQQADRKAARRRPPADD